MDSNAQARTRGTDTKIDQGLGVGVIFHEGKKWQVSPSSLFINRALNTQALLGVNSAQNWREKTWVFPAAYVKLRENHFYLSITIRRRGRLN